ncbi:MAG: hypothetical protein RLZZ316_2605 [Bacteroidota bacterium]
MTHQIVLFGAGKSATCLIDYLLQEAAQNNWMIVVADANEAAARQKIGNNPSAKAIATDVTQASQRQTLIENASIVISLLPPALHLLVAKDCITYNKNLLTASYVDDNMRALEKDIQQKGLLFLCEMGLDPGIDHMSAMELLHRIYEDGGTVTSFKSHCGGLVAPESDNNPWHYKISWNPRNVVMAGKAGAVYKENGHTIQLDYENLFDAGRTVAIPGLGNLAWYPNRDSLSYTSLYGIDNAATFIRTTLRYPEFSFGWKNIIDLKLTDEEKKYATDGLSLQQFFKQHLEANGFGDWLQQQLMSRFDRTKELLKNLQQLLDAEAAATPAEKEAMQEFLTVDDTGSLETHNLTAIKNNTAATVSGQMHEANLSMTQLFFLGLDDDATLINKGLCSAADVLQFALEQKLLLAPQDKDMIVMLHEIEYTINKRNYQARSTLLVKGEDNNRTAMAKTVGLPLGIAAKLILNGTITTKGLHIPVLSEIYQPVLAALKEQQIVFNEITQVV